MFENYARILKPFDSQLQKNTVKTTFVFDKEELIEQTAFTDALLTTQHSHFSVQIALSRLSPIKVIFERGTFSYRGS